MSANLQVQVDTLETRTDSLETIFGNFIISMNNTMSRMEADTKKLKDEMREFKDEMGEFKNEMREFKNETNKKWGELANKMGTLVEDMVAPNIPSIAGEYFGDKDFDFSAVRILKKNIRDTSMRREFDIIAVSAGNFIINETKSKLRPEDVREFANLLEEIHDYFPECKDKKIIPIISSLYIPENIKKHLTKNRIYAMSMKEGTMDLLNFEQIQ